MAQKLVGAALQYYQYNVPFPWLGSKATMLDIILPNIPEHEHYVEPFCGTAVVYLRKPLAKLNTLNDIDGNIVNFFRVLQDPEKTRVLLRRLRYTPYAKLEYRKACLLLSSGREIDDVTRAWAFYVAQYMGMKQSYYADPNGEKIRYSKTIDGGHQYAKLVSKVRRLVENAEKLRHCQILNDDGVDVMKRFDSKETFMFIDPPYISSTVGGKSKIYAIEYNDELHNRIIDFVLSARSKIMLASYPNELYDRLLDYGWIRIDKNKLIYAGNYAPQGKRKNLPRRIESLYLNYRPFAGG
jgi:DNA adenine methylase